MPDEENLTPAERELELALGGLRPAGPSIDRDRMMFRAGQASAGRRDRVWQGATAALALALGLSVFARPAPRQAERIVYLTPEVPATSAGPWASAGTWGRGSGSPRVEGGYLKLRNEVLARGVDALSEPSLSTRRSGGPSESLERSPDTSEKAPKWQTHPAIQTLKELGELL